MLEKQTLRRFELRTSQGSGRLSKDAVDEMMCEAEKYRKFDCLTKNAYFAHKSKKNLISFEILVKMLDGSNFFVKGAF
jgi:hypothetical protein